jgi:enoyl-CoA hydratase
MSALLVQTHAGVTTLTLNREPARNSLTSELIAELKAQIESAATDAHVRVLVLTGAGSRSFCSGADLSNTSFDGFLSSHESRRAYGQLLLQIQNFPKATIAKINGSALAGGLGLVLACDMAVAANDVSFGLPEIERGLFPMMVLALLQRHVGRKRALDWLLLGEKKTTAEALEAGLISRVVERAALDETVAAMATRLAEKSLAAIGLGKRAFFTSESLPLPAALEFLSTQLSISALTEDAANFFSGAPNADHHGFKLGLDAAQFPAAFFGQGPNVLGCENQLNAQRLGRDLATHHGRVPPIGENAFDANERHHGISVGVRSARRSVSQRRIRTGKKWGQIQNKAALAIGDFSHLQHVGASLIDDHVKFLAAGRAPKRLGIFFTFTRS